MGGRLARTAQQTSRLCWPTLQALVLSRGESCLTLSRRPTTSSRSMSETLSSSPPTQTGAVPGGRARSEQGPGCFRPTTSPSSGQALSTTPPPSPPSPPGSRKNSRSRDSPSWTHRESSPPPWAHTAGTINPLPRPHHPHPPPDRHPLLLPHSLL